MKNVSKVKIGKNTKINNDGSVRQIGVRDGKTERESLLRICDVIRDYLVDNQLITARKVEQWDRVVRRYIKGKISVKHIKRLIADLNPAMKKCNINMERINHVVDNDATIEGQTLVGKKVWEAVKEQLVGHYTLHEKHTGMPLQVAIGMLRASSERQRAFNEVVMDCIDNWHEEMLNIRFDEEWLKNHAINESVDGLHKLMAFGGDTNTAISHDIFNGWLQNKLQSPLKKMQLGNYAEWRVVSRNDAVEDGVAKAVDTEDVTGAGVSMFCNGKGWKTFFRYCEDLDDYEVISHSEDAKCDVKTSGLWVIVGTHTNKWLEVSKETFDRIAPKADGADGDDHFAVGLRGTKAEGLINRMPFSHHQGLIGIDIEYADEYLAKANAAGYPWDAPTMLELEDRDKIKIEYDTNLSEESARYKIAEAIYDSWNGANVGMANLTLQIGTILGWPEDELRFLGRIQCYCIDHRHVSGDELKTYYELVNRVTGGWENGHPTPERGVVPMEFAERFPEAQVVDAETPVGHFISHMMAAVNDCRTDFINTMGSPIIPEQELDEIKPTDKVIKYFNDFNYVLDLNKKDISNYPDDARKLRSEFMVRARGAFEEEFDDKIKAAVELVKLHNEYPRTRTWVVKGWNDTKRWPRTADQTLIRCISSFLCDALAAKKTYQGDNTEAFDTTYYPVRNSLGYERDQSGLDRAVLHVDKCKPNKRGFWKYRVDVDGKQVGWIKDKRDLRDYASRSIVINQIGDVAHVTIK